MGRVTISEMQEVLEQIQAERALASVREQQLEKEAKQMNAAIQSMLRRRRAPFSNVPEDCTSRQMSLGEVGVECPSGWN